MYQVQQQGRLSRYPKKTVSVFLCACFFRVPLGTFSFLKIESSLLCHLFSLMMSKKSVQKKKMKTLNPNKKKGRAHNARE